MNASVRHPDAPMGKERKYARPELERRFLFARVPTGTVLRRVLIEDRYLDGTRLRLRRMTDLDSANRPGSGPAMYKLAQKIPAPDGSPGLITNIYLSKVEYEALAGVAAGALRKLRLSIPPLGVDVFEGELDGLVLGEAEFASEEEAAALASPPESLAEVTRDIRFTGGRLVTTSRAELRSTLAEFAISLA
jgi:hypothetical protein